VVVHVDPDTLGQDGDGTRCHLEDGPGISAETSRRMACDCSLLGIVEDENGNPLNIGRKTRSIPPAMRRALKARDGGCRFPGCTQSHHVDGHHVTHWADGGETCAENLVLLCRFHHRLVHEGGYCVARLAHGCFVFRQPDGRLIPNVLTPRTATEDITAGNRQLGLSIDHRTGVSQWLGEVMDFGIAINGLVVAREKAKALESGPA